MFYCRYILAWLHGWWVKLKELFTHPQSGLLVLFLLGFSLFVLSVLTLSLKNQFLFIPNHKSF